MRWLSAVVVSLGFALVTCGLAGCQAPAVSDSDPADLAHISWTLADSTGTSADLAAADITATFDNATVSGFSGVNQYSGPYEASTDGSFSVGSIAGTLMAGPAPLLAAEREYLDLLAECESFSVDEGVLTLSADGGSSLVYREVEPPSLPGTMWNVVNYNNGKQAVVSIAPDSTLTLDFGTDGTVSGNGGVNTFSGPFESSDKTVGIGPLTSAQKAGPEELMDQEALYFSALENSTVWAVVQGRLEMRDASGATQVLAVPQQ